MFQASEMRKLIEQMLTAGDFTETPPLSPKQTSLSSFAPPASPSPIEHSLSQSPRNVQSEVKDTSNPQNDSDRNKTAHCHNHKRYDKHDRNLEPYAHCEYCCPHCGRMEIPTSNSFDSSFQILCF
jgi:hypothetical protein